MLTKYHFGSKKYELRQYDYNHALDHRALVWKRAVHEHTTSSHASSTRGHLLFVVYAKLKTLQNYVSLTVVVQGDTKHAKTLWRVSK